MKAIWVALPTHLMMILVRRIDRQKDISPRACPILLSHVRYIPWGLQAQQWTKRTKLLLKEDYKKDRDIKGGNTGLFRKYILEWLLSVSVCPTRYKITISKL